MWRIVSLISDNVTNVYYNYGVSVIQWLCVVNYN